MSTQPVQQFGRKAQLVLTPNNANSSIATNAATGSGAPGGTPVFHTATPLPAIDLSQLQFKFEVIAASFESPNQLICRVYNLGDKTIDTLIKEYSGVVLQAGYDAGNYGIVFQGEVAQYTRGKENNVDSFLEIRAGDGDLFYNFGFVNQSFPAGTTDAQVVRAVGGHTDTPVDPAALQFLNENIPTGGVILSSRGQVAFGLARIIMRDIARNNLARWSVQNGVIKLIPLNGYLPGEAVVLNSTTGMIGVPEATDQGVKVRCLLNAKITVGNTIRINQGDITTTTVKDRFYPNSTVQLPFVANTTRDGLYAVLVVQHSGDTRDVPWYTDIVCLAIDPNAKNPITNAPNPPNPKTIFQTLGTGKAF